MNIRKYREQKKMNQEQLANALSVERSTVAKWETGKAMPRADKLPELAKILDCEVSDLFEKEEAI